MSDPVQAEVVSDIEHDPSVAALTPSASLAVTRPATALVEPAADASAIRAAFATYTKLCDDLLDNGDYQNISGKQFKKRSAWRKLSVAFGVSDDIEDEDITRLDDGRILRAKYRVVATAPNGRHTIGVGLCDRYEKCGRNCERDNCDGSKHFSHVEHDVVATAHTRAKNRACGDLYGMGEVSAEEAEAESAVGHDAAQGSDDEDGFVTSDQMARVRDLTQEIDSDLKSSVVHNENGGKTTLIFGVEVRKDGKITLRQSAYAGLVSRLKNLAPGEDTKPDASDPEQAPFDAKDDKQPEDLTGAGAQPEPTPKGKGYDGWSKAELADECETHGLPKSGEKSKLVGRLRAWDATNRAEGYVEPNEKPF